MIALEETFFDHVLSWYRSHETAISDSMTLVLNMSCLNFPALIFKAKMS